MSVETLRSANTGEDDVQLASRVERIQSTSLLGLARMLHLPLDEVSERCLLLRFLGRFFGASLLPERWLFVAADSPPLSLRAVQSSQAVVAELFASSKFWKLAKSDSGNVTVGRPRYSCALPAAARLLPRALAELNALQRFAFAERAHDGRDDGSHS